MDSPSFEELAAFVPVWCFTPEMFALQTQIYDIDRVMERSDRPEDYEETRKSYTDQLWCQRKELLTQPAIHDAALSAWTAAQRR